MTSSQPRAFDRKDFGEIVIGSLTLALPLALTEEVWNLGTELRLLNVLLAVLVSYCVIGVYVRAHFYGGRLTEHRNEFIKRVMSVYLVTLLVSALCLLLVDKLPLFTDTSVALKRVVLTSLPASFFATVVDGLH